MSSPRKVYPTVRVLTHPKKYITDNTTSFFVVLLEMIVLVDKFKQIMLSNLID